MWKRFQAHGRDKEKQAQIGNPVLLETTYDEDQLRRNPRVADIQSGHHLPNVPGSRPQETLLPPAPPKNRASEVSVSSVYSRPSQDLTYYSGNPTATTPGYDISPPSSPEPEQQLSAPVDQPRRFRSMRDVSPMDEHRKKFEGSAIPVLRRAPPELKSGEQAGPKQKFWGGKVEPNGKVKWDAYSGEPSKAGKAASVTPASYSKATPVDRRAMGYKVSVTGPEAQRKVGFSDRVERLGSKSPPAAVDTASRQPWARTSGRSEIASPLKDDPNSKPLQIPRKQMSPTSMEPRGRVIARDVAPDTKSVARETRDTRDGDAHNDLIKPVVPLKAGRNSPFTSGLTSPTSPTHPGIGINSYPSPVTPSNQYSAPDTLKTVNEQTAASLPPSQRSETPPYNAADSTQPNQTPDKGKQPSDSRFSWTTYNSNTTYQHSPPPSPPPPLPTSTTKQENRPTPVTDTKSAATTTSSPAARSRADPMPARKPIGMPFVVPDTPITPVPRGTARIHTIPSARISDPPSPSAYSTFSSGTGYDKALPVPPTTLSAGDHISVLESQMEDLRIRRGNVYRLLQDLNNAAPPNPLITDFRRARLVEQRKRSFEDELNEIKREEYEIGMKLHRAWKKREREDPNTGSALWIRRVTS